MNILVDTHLLLWALTDDPKLPERARTYILDEKNIVFYSIASVWEVAIKHIKKPGQMLLNDEEFAMGCKIAGFKALSITEQQIASLKTLNRKQGKDIPQHQDPFDRIMLAQAKTENYKFLTHDSQIGCYDEPCVMVV